MALRLAAQRLAAVSSGALATSEASFSRAAGPAVQQLAARWQLQRPFSSEEEKREITDPVVVELGEKICQLNLLQVSDLTELLKQRLGLQPPMGGFAMPMGMPMAAAAAPAAAEAAAPKEEKTEFDVKLEGFDAASKIKVIKEIRGITELGLKEAKELVEGSPTVVKKAVKKEEAEEMKKKLEAAGAKVSLA